MADATGLYALRDLNASADDRALALLLFGGEVKSKFGYTLPFWPLVPKNMRAAGKSWQVPFVGHVDADEHTAGTEIGQAQGPPNEERTVPADQKEILAPAWITSVDRKLSHFDESYMSKTAMELAAGVDRLLESRLLRMICLGARQDVRTVENSSQTFDAGNLIRRNSASIAAAYPKSSSGSFNIQDDLADAHQLLSEKNVSPASDGFFHAAMQPRQFNVLLKDRGLTSEDWQGPDEGNNLIRRRIAVVENWMIHETNIMPQTTTAAGKPTGGTGTVTGGEAAYQGDFQYTAIVCMGALDAAAIGLWGGVEVEAPTWEKTKRAHFSSVAGLFGIKWIRPEACVEIYASTSAYTATGGVFAP